MTHEVPRCGPDPRLFYSHQNFKWGSCKSPSVSLIGTRLLLHPECRDSRRWYFFFCSLLINHLQMLQKLLRFTPPTWICLKGIPLSLGTWWSVSYVGSGEDRTRFRSAATGLLSLARCSPSWEIKSNAMPWRRDEPNWMKFLRLHTRWTEIILALLLMSPYSISLSPSLWKYL